MSAPGRFGRLIQRLHDRGQQRLSDAVGEFRGIGRPPIKGIPLQVDRNLTYERPDGVFITDKVGISWLAKDVPTASRGDLFVIGSSRYLVEKLIANDGWLLTAATIEEEA
ncbi:TPA: hypothetical protein SL402_002202 [Pseudomonas aeruginosa]|uniref:hypothetical protein n=1 Tax=Pseudomonas aeruginosa group TaxID=136841 RepID=UPI0004494195|nr:hypothetical protein [Pseudomonas aeruginosa]KEA25700.1 hypothetical protein BH77_09965 [Pseudomonas aeruginosa C2773C]MDG0899005.1 hypothetical protein [Pseudomonas sp. L01]EIZ0539017.1 hypothetical protein [Pseudomonas aeruginosa]EKW0408156.1 hypothetical protein [Pseudomonas aeruginosa]EKW1418626.1 hypothetical protein [Pseudomonas aeruginosa]